MEKCTSRSIQSHQHVLPQTSRGTHRIIKHRLASTLDSHRRWQPLKFLRRLKIVKPMHFLGSKRLLTKTFRSMLISSPRHQRKIRSSRSVCSLHPLISSGRHHFSPTTQLASNWSPYLHSQLEKRTCHSTGTFRTSLCLRSLAKTRFFCRKHVSPAMSNKWKQ